MKKRSYMFIALPIMLAAFPAMAEKKDHVGCDEILVKADKMGMMDEAAMQKMIDRMEEAMSQVKRKAARREERREGLRLHYAEMQEAMKEIHNMKLISGCQAAAHGASLETRIGMIEKRLDMMQVMMQQMLDHQQESERE
ncbi:MAG: hypothetical protein AB1810_08270 [Pseudomonadota bacterium]